MFNQQPTFDQLQTGKKISGFEVRKAQFSLAWDSGNNELNDYQRKKQKNKDVQVKLNYQAPDRNSLPVRVPLAGYNQVDSARPYQLESPYAQLPTEQPKPPSVRNIPPPASYDEEEVLGYLRKYQHIDQMPPDELEKVMAYYEGLKGGQPKASEAPVYKQPPPPQDPPRRSNSSRQSNPPPYQPAQRRQPIRPKETAGGIIYGNSAQTSDKPPSRYSQKNQGSVVIGDGYNYFKEEAHRKAVAEQQSQQYTQQQQIQQPVAYNPRNDYKKLSNIHFG